MTGEACEIVAAIRCDLEQAADAMLSAAEQGLRDLAAARNGDVGGLERIEKTLGAILEACAFQDLAGQRLSRLESAILSPATPEKGRSDPLLNGPAAPGAGLDQDAADALMRGACD